MKVKITKPFKGWEAGQVVDISKAAALRCISQEDCEAVKLPAKPKKATAAPKNRKGRAPQKK